VLLRENLKKRSAARLFFEKRTSLIDVERLEERLKCDRSMSSSERFAMKRSPLRAFLGEGEREREGDEEGDDGSMSRSVEKHSIVLAN
jgi:hypothetical protein